MCRSELSSHKSSWSDGSEGVVTSLHSFRHQEPSCRPAPATGDLVCEAMAEFVARLLINLERSAGPTNAGVRASRSQLPPLRVENCCRERHQEMEIARCVARPRARENYVEVWLTTKVRRPRMSSATRLERSSSAHSCNLCIGVASSPTDSPIAHLKALSRTQNHSAGNSAPTKRGSASRRPHPVSRAARAPPAPAIATAARSVPSRCRRR